FGRVLQIGVDDEDALAAAMREPGRERDLVTVIAREVDGDDMRIARREQHHHTPGLVARPVIDQDDLVILAGCGDTDPSHTPMHLEQALGLVVAGRHHRKAPADLAPRHLAGTDWAVWKGTHAVPWLASAASGIARAALRNFYWRP